MLTLYQVDPSLGRLDPLSLSDQALMEMLFTNVDKSSILSFVQRVQKEQGIPADFAERYERAEEEALHLPDDFFWQESRWHSVSGVNGCVINEMGVGYLSRIQDEHGNLLDACKWRGVHCADERVVRINLFQTRIFSVQFAFEYIPALVEEFALLMCCLQGTLETSVLPLHLTFFAVSYGALCGTLNFAGFPSNLKNVNVIWNRFSGGCALSSLPDAIIEFRACGNKFSGQISLNDLPRKMEVLALEDNQLSGCLRIEHLPHNMEKLYLYDNAFTGDFLLLSLPPHLKEIYISDNHMSGTVVLPSTTDSMHFGISGEITAVRDTKGNKHPWEDTIFAKNAEE